MLLVIPRSAEGREIGERYLLAITYNAAHPFPIRRGREIGGRYFSIDRVGL